jgi:cell division protein FtsL
MTVRLLNLGVIAALVLAAAYVYDIKYQSTLRAERVVKLRQDIRRERDAIASLRAEWAKLDSPPRVQALAKRHLMLKPLEPAQYDTLATLPERPTPIVPPDSNDPIALIIENADSEAATGSIPSAAE